MLEENADTPVPIQEDKKPTLYPLEELSRIINVQRQLMESGSRLAIGYHNHNEKKYKKLLEKEGGYNDQLEKFRMPLVLTGSNQEVLYGSKQEYLFNVENTTKINDKAKELGKTLTYEFDFFMLDFPLLTKDEKNKLTTTTLTEDGVIYSIDLSKIDREEYDIISHFVSNMPPYTGED